ncbi:hypothetical protein, partial [Morganella morganii]|uniref:hypothetical protein n=1 Tax=Morganella morganii TaxID=582 RepID=UPI001C8C8ECC
AFPLSNLSVSLWRENDSCLLKAALYLKIPRTVQISYRFAKSFCKLFDNRFRLNNKKRELISSR